MLFMLDWLLNPDRQCRVQIGLTKGEVRHASKNALRIGRQGEIRDRTAEGQHYRMAAPNLLTAIEIYLIAAPWSDAAEERTDVGQLVPPELLALTSPFGRAGGRDAAVAALLAAVRCDS